MSDASRSGGEPHDPDVPQPDGAGAEPARGNLELQLLPYFPTSEEPLRAVRDDRPFTAGREARPVKAPRDWGRVAAAASLAGVVLVGAAAAAAHVHAWRVTRAEEAQARTLSHRLDGMSTRLESLEANRSRDELANLKKVLAEIKAAAANTRDVGGAVAQLGQRVDKLEKDQGARLDKLGDRIEHDAAARVADVTARLDKLEAKAATPVPVAAPSLLPKAAPTPPAKPDVAKAEPGASNETTASIEKPRPRLRGFYLSEIHNGYAMIDSPQGEFTVAPGDFVPGGGRVLRIERHGRDWVVVTTQGQIVASD